MPLRRDGAHNRDLVGRLQAELPACPVESTEVLGISPDWVEAALFAWLAKQCLEGLPGNAPQVTGASGTRVLGGIYPGSIRG